MKGILLVDADVAAALYYLTSVFFFFGQMVLGKNKIHSIMAIRCCQIQSFFNTM